MIEERIEARLDDIDDKLNSLIGDRRLPLPPEFIQSMVGWRTNSLPSGIRGYPSHASLLIDVDAKGMDVWIDVNGGMIRHKLGRWLWTLDASTA